MGQWNITIRGTGCHHNKGGAFSSKTGSATDANRMAAEFVKELKEAGHAVVSASITYGGDEDITDADKYLADKWKQDEE